MTKNEALKLAMDWFCCYLDKSMSRNNGETLAEETVTAIKEALAQPEQLREENERLHVENRRLIDRIETIGVPVGVGGFATTTTAQRTWVGLTDEDIALIDWESLVTKKDCVQAIEAKLKEKNT